MLRVSWTTTIAYHQEMRLLLWQHKKSGHKFSHMMTNPQNNLINKAGTFSFVICEMEDLPNSKTCLFEIPFPFSSKSAT